MKSQIADLTKNGAAKIIVDVRRVWTGTIDEALRWRVFVAKGTLAMRETKGAARETIAAAAGDGSVALPVTVLIDTEPPAPPKCSPPHSPATSGQNRRRAHDGRAATQKLVRLPDGAGLWLSNTRYLTPAGTSLHEKGLEPNVAVDEPETAEFGQPAPTPPTRFSTRPSSSPPRKKRRKSESG